MPFLGVRKTLRLVFRNKSITFRYLKSTCTTVISPKRSLGTNCVLCLKTSYQMQECLKE